MHQHSLFKKKPPRTQVFLTADDIIFLDPKITSKSQAYRTLHAINIKMDRPKNSGITVETYCRFKFNGLATQSEINEVKTALGFKI